MITIMPRNDPILSQSGTRLYLLGSAWSCLDLMIAFMTSCLNLSGSCIGSPLTGGRKSAKYCFSFVCFMVVSLGVNPLDCAVVHTLEYLIKVPFSVCQFVKRLANLITGSVASEWGMVGMLNVIPLERYE